MFEGITEKLSAVFKKFRGAVRLSEADVEEGLKEIKTALLAADVNFKVVKIFLSRVKDKAVAQEVHKKLSPWQMIVKIVHEELIALLGGSSVDIALQSGGPTVILMAGLQGSGKTTSSGKLAAYLRKKNHKHPLLVAGDIYRPAAIKQLQVLGKELDIPVFTMGDGVSPVEIARGGVEFAKTNKCDVVIVDTAGRLHLDEELMDEIKAVRAAVNPNEVLLVVDAMTGQDAVNVAKAFNEALDITGVILTKLDGDTRGGAALSIREIAGKPIKFVGMGEKLSLLEPFHPERMASRILGMGDVLTLIEKAQEFTDIEEARGMVEKIQTASFDFNDFLGQVQKIRKMGPLADLMKMIPGLSQMLKGQDLNFDDKEINRMTAIITSMTHRERKEPDLIDNSRRKRIAAGSGNHLEDVNKLIRQFIEMRKMMRQLTTGKMPKMPPPRRFK